MQRFWVRAARLSVVLVLSVGACTLGMRDKDELSGGGGGSSGTGGGSDAGPCPDGYEDCDGIGANGCETFVLKDPKHCGGCGKACFTAGNAAVCNDGVCGLSTCLNGSLDCDSDPATCETNPKTSKDNCGYCGHVCALPNAVNVCTDGACAFTSCNPGYDDCDGLAATGCEASLKSAAACGACGAVCQPPNATGACDTGTCAVGSCNTGYADCDKVVTNGCESNLQTDPQNCGTCGKKCAAGQACKSGACEATSCTAPLADCDSDNSTCETNVQTSVSHCGFCNNPCSLPNATPECVGGQCKVGSCTGGYGDCDSNSPGCETQLGTTANCKACGDKCGGVNVASATCQASGCENVCVQGYKDCSPATAGCETNTASDPQNCGNCGVDCATQGPPNAVPSCVQGTCDDNAGCLPGFANCTSAPGCETNVQNDPNNCGACGRVCTGCSNGVCPPDVLTGISGAICLDTQNDDVYVGAVAGGIQRVPKSTWTATLVYPNAHPVAMDVSNSTGTIFWAESAGIYKGNVQGDPASLIASKAGTAGVDAASNVADVFFTSADPNVGGLYRVAQSGGPVTTLDTGPAQGVRASAADNLVVWAQTDAGAVRRSAVNTFNATTVSALENKPTSVQVDSTHIYWTNNGDGRIRRAPRAGGTATDIATGQTGAWGIAVDNTDVYWTTAPPSGSGGVFKAPKAGGTVTQLATNCQSPRGLLVDATRVYWVEMAGSGGGSLKRVQK